MTDREVPQGNQDGVSCPFCNGTDSATGIRPQPCHSCGGAGVITAASSGSEPSDASKNASGGGSQDSIDTELRDILYLHRWWCDYPDDEPSLDEDQAIERLLAWHNTQLKAELQKIPNFEVKDEPGNAARYIVNRIKELSAKTEQD